MAAPVQSGVGRAEAGGSLPRARAGAATRKSPNHDWNEDSHRLLGPDDPRVREARRGLLYAVADGVSTVDRGRWASNLATERIEGFFDPEVEPKLDNLVQLIGEIDWEIRGSGDGKGACTLSVLWLHAGMSHLLYVGDSGAWRLRDGMLSPITRAFGTGGRTLLDSYVGMGPDIFESLKIQSDPYRPGDAFVMVTDGVTEVVEPMDVSCALAGFRGSPRGSADAIVRLVDHRGGGDDATTVVIEVYEGDE